ncbi:hypothetical protein [Pseudomonas sp. MBLB4136]
MRSRLILAGRTFPASEDYSMDDYLEELLELRACEQDAEEPVEDATEL